MVGQGGAQPNAHVLILAIAALCHVLAGRVEEARAYAAAIRGAQPRFGVEDYLHAFQFSADAAALFRQAAQRIGLASATTRVTPSAETARHSVRRPSYPRQAP